MDKELLSLEGLTKKFGNKYALRDVDITLERGRIVGLLGPNGSGKTTLIKLLNGLLHPDGGAIYINGMAPCPETKSVVAYLPDRMFVADWMKVKDLIDMFADFYKDFNKEKAYSMLESLGISDRDRLKTMSKGTREKVQLVLVMSRDARLYVLDEPIGGVDPAARDYILRTILSNYREDATVLLSTHLIYEIENILDRVLFLRQGQIVLNAGVDEIRTQQGKSVDTLFREVFRC